VASCRRSGGSAWGTSRQRVLPVITTTGGRTSWHRAAGRVAAHGEHRGRRYCLSSLRQGVVRGTIAPSGGGQRMMSIEAPCITCHHRICAAGRAASHGNQRSSRYCLSSLRQRFSTSSAGRAASDGEHQGSGHYPSLLRRQYIVPKTVLLHRAAQRAGTQGERRGKEYCLSFTTAGVLLRGTAPPGGRQRMKSMQWVIDVTIAHAPLDRRFRMDASWQLLLPVITTAAVRKEAENTACHHYDRVVRRGVATPMQ